MERLEIHPVLRSAIPEVAAFLQRSRLRDAAATPLFSELAAESTQSLERRLRWLLVENPIGEECSNFGYCIRDDYGAIRGMDLAFPAAFQWGEKRLLAFGSGSFFVDPEARSHGFYLFKRYLSSPGYNFFFSASCNMRSAALWRHVDGHPIPGSDMEYVVPTTLETLLPAFAATRTGVAPAVARSCGRIADAVLRFSRRPASDVTVEPCLDWQKVSGLWHVHRDPNQITASRTTAFLQWQYGCGSPLDRSTIYLIRDKQGREGWFALGRICRGRQGKLRALVLLDAVWPRASSLLESILRESVRVAASEADLLLLRPRPELPVGKYSGWILARKPEAPRAFVVMSKVSGQLPVHLLNYDSNEEYAWAFQWSDRAASPDPAKVSSGIEAEPAQRTYRM
jgi:hypothetical protein